MVTYGTRHNLTWTHEHVNNRGNEVNGIGQSVKSPSEKLLMISSCDSIFTNDIAKELLDSIRDDSNLLHSVIFGD